jgi:hypothetical protein
MYMKQNHPDNPVLCDECGCEKSVLVSLTAFDLCLDCVRQINKTVAIWRVANLLQKQPNGKVLDEGPHQVIEPNETERGV